ncbi:MAG: UDP-N-acetylenolpyruvoylglucosamine reductase [Blastopirellula sp.]|nr:MAG: UDP-N-acetylenolpyruvoylglucosamine reductase [Blastopirellula sp.]
MELLKGFEHFVSQNEPLAPFTWLRIGGAAEYYAEPTNVNDLAEVVRRCREHDIPVRLLGNGSNLLIRDEGVPGMVIRLNHPSFSEISVSGQTVTAGGGARLAHVISTAVGAGLAGLESLVGIPGTIGGALHSNSGSHGSDIGQWTVKVEAMTRSGEVVQRSGEELQFAYRQSSLDELAILKAEFQLESVDAGELTRKMQKLWIMKKSSQPDGDQSTCCPFCNASDMSAGTLIEQAGLKGTSVGGAQVSESQGNFIIANADATADDVLRLMDLIRSRVHEVLGIELQNQIVVW